MKRMLQELPKSYRPVITNLIESGYRTKRTKKGIVIFSPDGISSIMVHRTPSDYRGVKNLIAQVHRFSDQYLPLSA